MGESYRNLTVWQRAIEMAMAVYSLTEEFPPRELYGLTSQLRRAAVSVPSNIAEGTAEFRQASTSTFWVSLEGQTLNCRPSLSLQRGLERAITERLKRRTGCSKR